MQEGRVDGAGWRSSATVRFSPLPCIQVFLFCHAYPCSVDSVEPYLLRLASSLQIIPNLFYVLIPGIPLPSHLICPIFSPHIIPNLSCIVYPSILLTISRIISSPQLLQSHTIPPYPILFDLYPSDPTAILSYLIISYQSQNDATLCFTFLLSSSSLSLSLRW